MDFFVVARVVSVVKGFVGETDECLDSAFVFVPFGKEIPLDERVGFQTELVDRAGCPSR